MTNAEPAKARAARTSAKRPHEAGLSRAVIIAAALQMMDARGVEAFSMRRLADHFAVSVQALYWHFSNKDELCRAVDDSVRDQVDITVDDTLAPAERLRSMMFAMRDSLGQHPSVIELGRRYNPPFSGPITSIGVRAINDLGVRDDDLALHYYRSLVWTVSGFTQAEHGLSGSVHHTRRALDSNVFDVSFVRQSSVPGEPAVPLPPVDLDGLFATVVAFFIAGLESTVAQATECKEPAP